MDAASPDFARVSTDQLKKLLACLCESMNNPLNASDATKALAKLVGQVAEELGKRNANAHP